MINPNPICKAAIEKWGPEKQILMAIEEMGELTQQLAKHLNGRGNVDNICDEIADVHIMILQLATIFDGDTILARQTFKLQRLSNKLFPRPAATD